MLLYRAKVGIIRPLFGSAVLCCVFGCGDAPDIPRLEQELGIEIPEHKVMKGHADHMGFDPTFTYTLCFDSMAFHSLMANIRSSHFFSVTALDSFERIPFERRKEVIVGLWQDTAAGFWTEASNGMIFVAPQLASPSVTDSLSQWQRSSGTLLISQHYEAKVEQLYSLQCSVDTATRCLTYEKGYY